MLERIKKLYEKGKLTKVGLAKAVKDKLITPYEYTMIVGETYEER